jgi:hypothetical protein
MLGEYSQKRNRKIPPPHGPEPCDFKTALNGDFDSRSSGYAIFTGDFLGERRLFLVGAKASGLRGCAL